MKAYRICGTPCITGVLEGEKREKGEESVFIKIMAENFQNMWREKNIHIHDTHKTSNRFT